VVLGRLVNVGFPLSSLIFDVTLVHVSVHYQKEILFSHIQSLGFEAGGMKATTPPPLLPLPLPLPAWEGLQTVYFSPPAAGHYHHQGQEEGGVMGGGLVVSHAYVINLRRRPDR